MSPRGPVNRFMAELRRRHVPQTAAVYLVAAWAAIQFADVVAQRIDGVRAGAVADGSFREVGPG